MLGNRVVNGRPFLLKRIYHLAFIQLFTDKYWSRSFPSCVLFTPLWIALADQKGKRRAKSIDAAAELADISPYHDELIARESLDCRPSNDTIGAATIGLGSESIMPSSCCRVAFFFGLWVTANYLVSTGKCHHHHHIHPESNFIGDDTPKDDSLATHCLFSWFSVASERVFVPVNVTVRELSASTALVTWCLEDERQPDSNGSTDSIVSYPFRQEITYRMHHERYADKNKPVFLNGCVVQIHLTNPMFNCDTAGRGWLSVCHRTWRLTFWATWGKKKPHVHLVPVCSWNNQELRAQSSKRIKLCVSVCSIFMIIRSCMERAEYMKCSTMAHLISASRLLRSYWAHEPATCFNHDDSRSLSEQLLWFSFGPHVAFDGATETARLYITCSDEKRRWEIIYSQLYSRRTRSEFAIVSISSIRFQTDDNDVQWITEVAIIMKPYLVKQYVGIPGTRIPKI